MVKWCCCIVVLFLTLPAVAQQDSVRKYLNADLQFTNRKNAVYAAMAIKSGNHWLLYAVYPDTIVLLQVYFKDAGLSIKDGSYTLYHPKKILAQQGTFTDNVPNGKWQSWYPNGQLKNEGLLVNNHFAGNWKSWYDNGQLMSEQTFAYNHAAGGAIHQHSPAKKVEKLMEDFSPVRVLDGRSATWYKNGKQESLVNYHNDTLSGQCSWFYENGNLSSKETYINGKVTDLECYDSTGKYTGATCSILKLPVLVHPFFTALDYIEFELHKEKNKGVEEGDVEVSFMVTKTGQVDHLVFISSPGANLTKLVRRIFSGMPAWSPAVTHNRATDHPVTLTIPYYRE